MKTRKSIAKFLVTGTLALAMVASVSMVSAGCGGDHDIVDTAAEAGTFNTLVAAVNAAGLVEALAAILTYHVVPGKILSADVKTGRVETLEGGQLSVSMKKGALMVDQSKIVATDITATNGVIHVIDAVMMPEQLRSAIEAGGPTEVASNLR